MFEAGEYRKELATTMQLTQLWALQGKQGQGYFCSKRLKPEAATAFIAKEALLVRSGSSI